MPRAAARSSAAGPPAWRAPSRGTARRTSRASPGCSTGSSRSSRTTPTARATRSVSAGAASEPPGRTPGLMARTPPSRISQARILADLRLAARRGDRAALALALDRMRTLAHSPRYWEKYLTLLANPLARLVELLVIKQGERVAHQKGWKLTRPAPARTAKPRKIGRASCRG